MPEIVTPALRKDAALNRQRLLDAAADLFATRGLGVTLNDIAHHAGVGVGTAYRRFANKEEVIDALFEQRLVEVGRPWRRRPSTDPDAWNGLLTFLERALHMRHGDRGLNEIMNNPVLGDARVQRGARPDRADHHPTGRQGPSDRASSVRTSTRPTSSSCSLRCRPSSTQPAMEAPDLYRRYLTFFLDGIHTERSFFTELPVAALTPDQTHQAMTQERPDNN